MSTLRSSILGECIARLVGTFVLAFAATSAVVTPFLNASGPIGVAIPGGRA